MAVGSAFFGTLALPAGELAMGVVPGAVLDVGPVELVAGVVLDEAAEVVVSCADCIGSLDGASSAAPPSQPEAGSNHDRQVWLSGFPHRNGSNASEWQ